MVDVEPSQATLIGQSVGIACCVVLSSLFSGSETALTSLRDARLEQLLQERRTGNHLLHLWRKTPATVLSYLLVANNLVNILASSLATDLSLRLLGNTSFRAYALALSVGIMTFLILLFGEVVPKTFARHNPRVILMFLPLLSFFYFLLWPFARVLALVGRGFISLTGGDPSQSMEPVVTEEELEYLIERGGSEGSLEVEKQRMLSGVLQLEDRIVKEVMVPRTEVSMFDDRATLSEVMSVISETKFSRYPVFQGARDKIIGLFYARDLLDYFKSSTPPAQPFKLRLFVHPPYYVPETKRLDELLREFQREHIHMAVVVDEYGGTAGIITLEDVIEEMVGEIYDEYDEAEDSYVRMDDNVWVVDSRLPVEDLDEELNIDVLFPDDREYETVGGLVMELAGSVPSPEQVFVYRNPDAEGSDLTLKVLQADDVRVEKIEVTVTPAKDRPA